MWKLFNSYWWHSAIDGTDLDDHSMKVVKSIDPKGYRVIVFGQFKGVNGEGRILCNLFKTYKEAYLWGVQIIKELEYVKYEDLVKDWHNK